ncbi:uncharacterized protein RSE6_14828 [Rhynchosporium secalis]|uniref:Uncharacterized protein n=1 Tax=Rhynchosporium secalis TaxID=38038 RepID=A0A1E1MW85_RHYSE|nr:uncharacterized protein RSE6_14828 [Rhynchosporium secalis]
MEVAAASIRRGTKRLSADSHRNQQSQTNSGSSPVSSTRTSNSYPSTECRPLAAFGMTVHKRSNKSIGRMSRCAIKAGSFAAKGTGSSFIPPDQYAEGQEEVVIQKKGPSGEYCTCSGQKSTNAYEEIRHLVALPEEVKLNRTLEWLVIHDQSTRHKQSFRDDQEKDAFCRMFSSSMPGSWDAEDIRESWESLRKVCDPQAFNRRAKLTCIKSRFSLAVSMGW